ncbi:MAG: hypothetical protein OXI79_14760 [Gammaproteobacteria bacterium]|nr:hypothetical protein [Gammaproteobacteria bacterium]
MSDAIAGRGRWQAWLPPAGVARPFAIASISFALAIPGVGAVPDTPVTGVAVFGSYLNPAAAGRQAQVIGERLGVTLAVAETVVETGAVFHRVVSETLPEREARQLLALAAERGQDGWFAVSGAPPADSVATEAPSSTSPDPPRPTAVDTPSPPMPGADPASPPTPAAQVADTTDAIADTPGPTAETALGVAKDDTGGAPHLARVDLTGSLSAETRRFFRGAGHTGQGSQPNSLVVKPQLYLEHRAGWSFTLSPFYRFDNEDSRRTHADVHEAYALFLGVVGDAQWELRVGVDRVFWGVVESNNLVDIVNQVDLVEHPDEKSKLGQFMGHFTYAAPWGVVELLGMPHHRQRTFPGRSGRLRFPWLVDADLATYESGAEERHVDVAARYSHTVGAFDFGISAFEGTSREPFLIPTFSPGRDLALAPHYPQIRQVGLDGQLTAGAWLLKLEAVHRTGMLNRLGREEPYSSLVLGAEYTFYSVFGLAPDITVLTEWCYDERGIRSTTKFENDAFLAARLAFNDVQGTELLVSTLQGTDHDSRVFTLELNRRLSDRWSMAVEAIALRELDPTDILYETRRDSFVEVGIVYSF